MELDVAPRIDRVLDTEVIDETLLGRSLIDVTHERIRAQGHLAQVRAVERYSLAARVEGPPCREFLCDHGLAARRALPIGRAFGFAGFPFGHLSSSLLALLRRCAGGPAQSELTSAPVRDPHP